MLLAGDTLVNKAGLLCHFLEAHQAGARGCCGPEGSGDAFASSVFLYSISGPALVSNRTGLWTGLIGSSVPASVHEHTGRVAWWSIAFYFFFPQRHCCYDLSSLESWIWQVLGSSMWHQGNWNEKNLCSPCYQRPPPPWLMCKPCGFLRRRPVSCSHPRWCSNGQDPEKASAVMLRGTSSLRAGTGNAISHGAKQVPPTNQNVNSVSLMV